VSTKPSFISKLTGAGASRDRASRLEAFLSSVPGEYCGWSPDGAIAFSEGFCRALGLDAVQRIDDVQAQLMPSDAAALESLFARLQREGEAFTIEAKRAEGGQVLRLSGRRGRSGGGEALFDVLWLEDVSAEHARRRQEKDTLARTEEERNRLQEGLDHIPAPVWLRNARTEIVWCNRAYAQAVGQTAATVAAEQKELSAKPAAKSAKAAPGKALAQLALDTGAVETVAAHVIMAGRRCLMNVHEIPLHTLHMTLGYAQDMTREEELRKEQTRYASANKELLEQLGSAIGIFDAAQKLEFYNSAFSQLWHLEEQYLNTHPRLGDIMEKLREARRLPEQIDFRRFKEGWLSMFTSLITPHEEMLYLPDASALRMLAVPHPMGGLMMTFEDVTSRLELESSYNTLIAVQKETLDNLAEGVAVYGGDGRLKLWNPSFTRLWNLHPEDMNGEPHVTRLAEKMKQRFPRETAEENRKALVAQSIDRRFSEGRLAAIDGTLIAYSTVPLPDGGTLVTHVDVTDKVRAENALREKNAALETAERLKLDFLANVSYQLRTPLNAIMGFAEILGKEYFGPLNLRQKEYSGGIQEAGHRLISLIDDILDLSTIEAGYLELSRGAISVGDVLNDIHLLTREWARKEGITVRLDSPPDIGMAYADERRIKQVLLNLVRNAITFTPQGGEITLQARVSGNDLAIAVTDTGPGIPEDAQKRVFEPFERVHDDGVGPARRGAGLGLTLVKNIIELHGGRVELASGAGQGTRVTIHLPRRQGQ
jgi:signal transduction histidine kinase